MRIRKSILLACGLLSAVAAVTVGPAVGDVLAASDPPAATTERGVTKSTAHDFEWSWALAPGKTLEIKNVNGAIRAERATGPKAEVTAVKTARRSDPDEVKIEVIEHAGGVTICTVYPKSWLGSPNRCAPGESGHMEAHNNDVKVEYTVRVPAGVKLVARSVNGDVEVRSLDSPVEAVTVNGSVDVSSAQSVAASTVNGSIRAAFGKMVEDETSFRTVNGSITLDLPATVNADLRASTVNGHIESDLPLTVQGRISRREIRGAIGKGGPELRAETVNGSIHLRSRDSSI